MPASGETLRIMYWKYQGFFIDGAGHAWVCDVSTPSMPPIEATCSFTKPGAIVAGQWYHIMGCFRRQGSLPQLTLMVQPRSSNPSVNTGDYSNCHAQCGMCSGGSCQCCRVDESTTDVYDTTNFIVEGGVDGLLENVFIRRIHPETCPSTSDPTCYKGTNAQSEKFLEADLLAEWNRIKNLFLSNVERRIILSLHFDNGGPYNRVDYADTPLAGPAKYTDAQDFGWWPSERSVSSPKLKTLNAGLGRIWSGNALITAKFRYPLQSNGQRAKSKSSGLFKFWTSAEDYDDPTPGPQHYVVQMTVKYHYVSTSGTHTLFSGSLQGFVYKSVSVPESVIKDILRNPRHGGEVHFVASSAETGSWAEVYNPIQIDDSWFEFDVDTVDATAQMGVYGQSGHLSVFNNAA